MNDLTQPFLDHWAIVTGGTRGIGRAISLRLAQKGAKVLALYARDRNSAESIEKEALSSSLYLKSIKCDITREEKVSELVNFLKDQNIQIKFLIHCAASGVHRNALDLSLKHFRWTFDINVFSIHHLVTKLHPLFANHGGRIIGVTSSGGTRVIPYYSAIGASKGALESLFRHYAYEFSSQNIAVNLVCPGLVITRAIEAFPEHEHRTQKTLENTPSGNLTKPEDVAALVEFLCLPSSQQIQGQTIIIDGGKSLLA